MDPAFFIENALVPFSATLGATAGSTLLKPVADVFDNWFYIKFGAKTELERKKRELKNENQLDLYKMELEKEQGIGKLQTEISEYLINIKPENIQIPDQHLVALIMENIHLYLSVDEIRKRFAKLLARSADKSYEEAIHPAFIEVVKTITTKDAVFLNSLGILPFSIVDVIDIKSFPDKDGFSHGYSLDKMKNRPIHSFILKLKKDTLGLPVIQKGKKLNEYKNFFIENESLESIYFLEKHGIIKKRKIDEAEAFPQFMVDDYAKITKYLVERHPETLKLKEYVETAFNTKTNISHHLFLLELTYFGSSFLNIVLK